MKMVIIVVFYCKVLQLSVFYASILFGHDKISIYINECNS